MYRRSKYTGPALILAAGLAALVLYSRTRDAVPQVKPAFAPKIEESIIDSEAVALSSKKVSPRDFKAAKTGETDTETANSHKVELLMRILDSKNDNDPRLDTDFRNLDSSLKSKLQRLYRDLSLEKLNSRGMLVFLLGREIGTTEDAEFMNQVLQEPPCKGLSNCRIEDGRDRTSEEFEHESEVTLAYPQIIATVSLVKAWSAITALGRREELVISLKRAAESTNAALARSARAALTSIEKAEERL